MLKPKNTKLTGQVISVEKASEIGGPYWVDIGLKLSEGHFINIQYKFNRKTIRENITKCITEGMTVTVTISGLAELDEKFEYCGIGSIQIHDLSNELDRFVKVQFRQKENNPFTQDEVEFINLLLDNAKQRIKETFQPNDKVMANVEKHLDSLKQQSKRVTRYDWRRLFVSCVVSISIDLGFGVAIPEVLYNLFKKLVEELIEYRLPAPNHK